MVKFGIVEYGQKLAQVVEKALGEELVNATFVQKRANDLFDLLAHARKLSGEVDHLVIIVEMEEEASEQRTAFYNGLAVMEAETGKPVFKLIYNAGEGGEKEALELAHSILEQLYGKKKKETKDGEEDEEDRFGLPEAEEEEPFELEDADDEK